VTVESNLDHPKCEENGLCSQSVGASSSRRAPVRFRRVLLGSGDHGAIVGIPAIVGGARKLPVLEGPVGKNRGGAGHDDGADGHKNGPIDSPVASDMPAGGDIECTGGMYDARLVIVKGRCLEN